MENPKFFGQLLIITAPSGAGKTSLIKSLLQTEDQLKVAVSHTTRPIRPGEREGSDYFFVSKESFRKQREAGEFFESAEVFGHLYGTGIKDLETKLSSGVDVILEIDWQGAKQVRSQVCHSVWVFIAPPSINALQTRLETRGQDSRHTINDRMNAAREEISHWKDADYLIINDAFDVALAQLRSIVNVMRLRTSREKDSLTNLMNALITK